MLERSIACLAAVMSFALGCSSGGGGNNDCAAYSPPAGTDLTQPAVTFKGNVVPIFVMSCAFDSCHAAKTGANNGVYLGSKDPAQLDTAAIRASIVGVAAQEAPSLHYVEPGAPAQSYLMHKIDGDLCVVKGQCARGDCGSTMPQGSDLLPVDARDTIRRWIAQGAKDD